MVSRRDFPVAQQSLPRANAGAGPAPEGGSEPLIIHGARAGLDNTDGGDVIIDLATMDGAGAGRGGMLIFRGLPDYDPMVVGAAWINDGVLEISAAKGTPIMTKIVCGDQEIAVTKEMLVAPVKVQRDYVLDSVHASLLTADDLEETVVDVKLNGSSIFKSGHLLQLDPGATDSVGSVAPAELAKQPMPMPTDGKVEVALEKSGPAAKGLVIYLRGHVLPVDPAAEAKKAAEKTAADKVAADRAAAQARLEQTRAAEKAAADRATAAKAAQDKAAADKAATDKVAAERAAAERQAAVGRAAGTTQTAQGPAAPTPPRT